MTIRKNWFTYIYLTIFGICMGYALFSGILNIGNSAKNPYLCYGVIIISMGILWLIMHVATIVIRRFNLNYFLFKNRLFSIILEITFVVAVLAVATALRLWVITNLPITPASDYGTYYQVATMLSQGNLIKDGVGLCDYISEFPHVIGYPYILSLLYRIVGVSVSAGLYLNLAASLIGIFLAYRITRMLCGRVGGMITLILVAFWPSQIIYSNHLASEPVFTSMMLFSLWVAVYLFKGLADRLKPSTCLILNIILGISLALASAVRPMSVILLIAIVICILPCSVKLTKNKNEVGLLRRGMYKGWICALVIVISYLVCSQITSMEIAKAIDRELPGGSVSFGYNLLVGLNVEAKGAWNDQDAKLLKDRFSETDSAAEAHKACRDEAFKRLKNDPIGIANLIMEKYTFLWKNDDYAFSWNLLFLEQQQNLTPERKAFLNNIIPWNNVYYLMCIFFSAVAGAFLWYKKREAWN